MTNAQKLKNTAMQELRDELGLTDEHATRIFARLSANSLIDLRHAVRTKIEEAQTAAKAD